MTQFHSTCMKASYIHFSETINLSKVPFRGIKGGGDTAQIAGEGRGWGTRKGDETAAPSVRVRLTKMNLIS